MNLLFMGIGVAEIIILFISLIIPIAIILVIVSYFRKILKLKQEQVELLRRIADKKD